jgi:hypothetical protein
VRLPGASHFLRSFGQGSFKARIFKLFAEYADFPIVSGIFDKQAAPVVEGRLTLCSACAEMNRAAGSTLQEI